MSSFATVPDVSKITLTSGVIDVRYPEYRKRKGIRSFSNESGLALKERKRPRRKERGTPGWTCRVCSVMLEMRIMLDSVPCLALLMWWKCFESC